MIYVCIICKNDSITIVQADYGRRGKLGNSGGIELGVPAESGHQGRPFY